MLRVSCREMTSPEIVKQVRQQLKFCCLDCKMANAHNSQIDSDSFGRAATIEALLGVLGIRDNWANYLSNKG